MRIDDNKKLSEYLTSSPLELATCIDIATMLAEMVYREHRQTTVIGCLTTANIYILWDERSARLSERMDRHAPYSSPEQSGRLNRVPDARSDLYSLGVIYYELLTGQLPIIPASDGDWDNAHIWQAPQPLSELRPETGGPLQAIVMKLLAKSPADRYQSAYGVLDDLERCRRMLASSGELVPFEIGRLDTSRSYRPSGTLYGRSDAIRQLEAGLEQAANGALTFRWVTGGEGIGKTALVHELRLTAARWGGRFVEGECPPSGQAVPYAPLIHALRQWIRQFWSEPDEVVVLLKERIQAEFGQAARTVVALLPEAAPLFGYQEGTPDAGGLPENETKLPTRVVDTEESRMSFGLLLPRLIRFLAEYLSPIVLFIDRMERADGDTVAVIRALELEQEAFGLLVIGACKTGEELEGDLAEDNRERERKQPSTRPPSFEVSWLDERVRAHPAEHLALPPLGYEEIRQFVADALHENSIRIRLLAHAVYKRTGGSPRAASLLLEGWIQKKNLIFDDQRRQWTWDADIVHSANASATELRLMETSFVKLPDDTKELLAMAAASGMSFRLSLLSEACDYTPEVVSDMLRDAEVEGIIGRENEMEPGVPQENIYLFLHDHLHQLAYAFDASRNAHRHWRIGRLLQNRLSESGDASLPAAIDQLNLSIQAMTEQERQQLATDNLQASLKGLKDGDYARVKRYAEAGLRLVAEPKELEAGSVYFQLKLNMVWAAYMCGHSTQAKELLLELMGRGGRLSRTEHLQMWTPLIQFHTFVNGETAIQYGKQALEGSGWELKEKSSLLSIVKEVMRTQVLLYRKRGKLQGSQHAPHDKEYEVLCGLMLRLAFPLLLHDPKALIELYARFIRYGIGKGMNESLTCIIGTYEILLQRVLPNFAQAGLFTDLTNRSDMDLSESHFKYRFAFISGIFKQLESNEESTAYLEHALRRGMEAGDGDFVNMTVIACLITHNRDLFAFSELLDYFTKHVRRYANVKTLEIVQIAVSYAAALRDESALERFVAIPEAASGASEEEEDNYSYCCKLEAAYLVGRYREALHWAKCGRANEFPSDWARIRKHRLYEALTLAALYPKAIAEERKRIRQALRAQLRKMAKWKGIFGFNSTAHTLMKAEWKRISGKSMDALREYMAAVKQARSEKNGLMEGIACERLALYYEQDMISRSGAMIAWMDACTAYSAWGATAKVTHIRTWQADLLQVVSKPYEIQGRIESYHPRIRLPQSGDVAEHEIETNGDEILEQIVNGFGVRRNRWPESFLEAALRQSGAERGVVLNCQENDFVIEAQLDMSPRDETDSLYAESVVRHAVRTNEPLVLHDAFESYFVKDAYIASCRPRSVLCMPIAVPGARSSFALYLENRHVEGVFTNRDLNVLELIATRTIYINMLENEAAVSEAQGEETASEDHASQVSASASTPFFEPLTERESEILSAIAEGLSNREIAERFGIVETTVKTHTTRIFSKLGVKRRGQAVALAKHWKIIN
ncbi:hypothetical protein PAT3040_01396 [Paenibacillus agaridevorans]|uniref:HTH luxR-type domain-containing protein n=1 Tax=Paenibacillus agaridevorans TaxID=171404 RepID=A0A2R5EL80_9BACL|nr:AAA family ATPase [Paenibacillus agaridevorans]GBG06855.1 hypothetical protein PAT3040_01396 [Paenibacillus agaridevorans]